MFYDTSSSEHAACGIYKFHEAGKYVISTSITKWCLKNHLWNVFRGQLTEARNLSMRTIWMIYGNLMSQESLIKRLQVATCELMANVWLIRPTNNLVHCLVESCQGIVMNVDTFPNGTFVLIVKPQLQWIKSNNYRIWHTLDKKSKSACIM